MTKYIVVYSKCGKTVPEYYIFKTICEACDFITELNEDADISDGWWKTEIIPAHSVN